MVGNLRGSKTRAAAEIKFAELKSNFSVKAAAFEAESRLQRSSLDFKEAIDFSAKTVLDDPTQFESVINDTNEFLETSNLPASKVPSLKKAAVNSITKAMLQGEITRDPQDALEQLLDGDFSKFLEVDDVVALRKTALKAIEQEEKEIESMMRERQGKNEFDFSNRVIEGTDVPTLEEIDDAVTVGDISPKAGASLQKMIVNPPAREDNPYVMATLDTALVKGELSTQDVIENSGELSSATRARYLKAITSGIQTNPAVKRAVSLLDAQVEEESLGVRALEDESWFAESKEELFTRSLGGAESPIDVAREIIQKRKQVGAVQKVTKRKQRIVQEVGNSRQALIQKQNDILEQRSDNLISDKEYKETYQAIQELLQEAE